MKENTHYVVAPEIIVAALRAAVAGRN